MSYNVVLAAFAAIFISHTVLSSSIFWLSRVPTCGVLTRSPLCSDCRRLRRLSSVALWFRCLATVWFCARCVCLRVCARLSLCVCMEPSCAVAWCSVARRQHPACHHRSCTGTETTSSCRSPLSPRHLALARAVCLSLSMCVRLSLSLRGPSVRLWRWAFSRRRPAVRERDSECDEEATVLQWVTRASPRRLRTAPEDRTTALCMRTSRSTACSSRLPR